MSSPPAAAAAATSVPPTETEQHKQVSPGMQPHLMIWFSVRLMSSSEMLFSAMFRAMKAPMYTMPLHCFSSVRRWLSQGSRIATGASTQKLKAMWPAMMEVLGQDNMLARVLQMFATALHMHRSGGTAYGKPHISTDQPAAHMM